MIKRVQGEAATRREDELLICCARVSQGPEARARMEELVRQPLDWTTVLKRSWWHRIRPLTYTHLRSQPCGVVPDNVLRELAGHANELAERNQRLWKTLNEVSALFEDAKLRLLVFKGPTLAVDAYGDLNLRECGDLDLLLHRDDFDRAADLLGSNGFTYCWDRAERAKVHQVFACEFERNGVELDVHWDLAPGWFNYKVDFDRLWEDGLPLTTQSRFARKMRPEDAIVVLCMHGTKHWWERLRWICDIAELISSGRIEDWDRVKAGAARAHSHRSVLLGLWLTADLLQVNLPAKVRQELKATAVVKRLGTQVGVWLGHADRASELRSLRDRFTFRIRLCERVRDRLPQILNYLQARRSRLGV